jgi:8-oxo-dGTP pyrophosphatase MutT (NUDIX family)
MTANIQTALGDSHTKIIISMKTNNIICSGAIVYALDTKRFLFLHRVKGRSGNLWGLVGGTNEETETPWEGLKREIFEEIGEISIKKTMPLETFVSNDTRFHFHTYLCVVEHEFLPVLNDEHDGYAWVEFGKWPRPLHHGLNNTLQNKVNLKKLETVFKVIDLLD